MTEVDERSHMLREDYLRHFWFMCVPSAPGLRCAVVTTRFQIRLP